MRVVELSEFRKAVFVGDTHGDLEASKHVIKKFAKEKNTAIVFLGDYVDRGEHSRENIDFLLQMKQRLANRLCLLMGNHECYPIMEFSPCDFWTSLNKEELDFYWRVFKSLPFVARFHDVLAIHAALPNVEKLEDFERIKLGSDDWLALTWGDFVERDGDFLGFDYLTGRPVFGRHRFARVMGKLNMRYLIRSHQPNAKESMFNGQCITIFTSAAYGRERTVAIAKRERNETRIKVVKLEEL